MGLDKTMKKLLLATVALATIASAPSFAADLAARRVYTKAPAVEPLPTWAGFYIGAMGGYGSQDGNLGAKGGFAGGTIGYNWQQANIVYGIEADAAWADLSNNTAVVGFPGTLNSKIQDWGTVRGRIGYAFGPALLYATGGYAWSDNRLYSTFFNSSNSSVLSGWTVGAGAEYMFAPKWSLKAEYLYKSFDSKTYTYTGGGLIGTVNTGTTNIHSVQVGINYHF